MKQNKLKTIFISVCALLTLSAGAQTVCWLAKPEYLSVKPFGNKLYKVNTYNYQGIVNGKGRTITTADSITFLTNGYALALSQFGDRYLLKGIINREGNFTQFRGEYYATEKSFFSEDKCLITNKKGRFGYIDPSGNIIINCSFLAAEPFRGGAAEVMKPKKGALSFIKASSEGIPGYINARGEDCNAPAQAPDPILTANKPYQPTYNPTYTVYEEKGVKGYMVNGDVLLTAQFEEAGLFTDGLAIVKLNGKYGILRYLNGTVDCKINEKSGKLDVSAIIPPAWDDKEARLMRISNAGQRLSLALVGMRSMRSLTADVPIEEGSHQYELSVEGLTIWKGSISSTKEKVNHDKSSGISVSAPASVTANKKGVCSFSVRVTNRTSSSQNITVSLSTGGSKSVKVGAGRTGSVNFSVKVSKETRCTISARCAGGTSSFTTTLKSSFVL